MITRDRWQKIKAIFYAAQERTPAERPDFLHEVCRGDELIREKVEALLTADAGNEDFLSVPAYEFAAGMLADEPSEFSAGQEIGRYTIQCSLGAGGMGQIYLAQDSLLGRRIALKLISREFATDPHRVHRFEQEARAASALNHPNVCVIHEIGMTENGRHFIAMEHIQGTTLRDQLSLGTLKPLQALQIAVQVAAALASAHAVGIVHRDVKPENIMVRPDGYVKVLDFGLAKLTENLPAQVRANDLSTKVRTESGTLMGTVKYMSPEQLREDQLDERTDIWSLGVVLYEMLTRRTPFEARTTNDTIALILSPQPPALQLPDDLSSQFREVVTRALEKDRAARYQTVTKLAADLQALQRELSRRAEDELDAHHGMQPPVPLIAAQRGRQKMRDEAGSAIFTRIKSQAILTADLLLTGIRSHKTAALFTGASSVLALLLLLPNLTGLINQVFRPAGDSQQVMKMKSLTNAGTSVCAAISFDGKLVAHAEERDGRQRLVVTGIATSAAYEVVPSADVQYLGVSFSRDNNYLYFTRKEKNGSGSLYRLALPGSDPIKVKNDVDSPISFSPQQDRFAFIRFDETTSEYSLMLSNLDGSNERRLATRKNGDTFSVYGLAWSPDGNMVVCPSSYWDKGFNVHLVGIDLKTGQEQVIGDQSWFSILQVAWQDDMRGLLISAREQPTTPFQLWRITYPEGGKQRITNDLAEYRGVSLSGENIVTVRTDRSWRIWVASLDDLEHATVIASGVGLSYGLSWTGKGRIVFSSMAQDRLNISRVDPDGSHQIQLTLNAGDNYTPASSPDGRYIVFASNRSGAFNIWLANADDGSEPKQLTFTDGNFYPTVSSDNHWIAYDNQVNTKLSVWKIPLEGGEAVKVAEKYRMPAFSPDNQFIACRYDLESGSRDVGIFSAASGDLPLRTAQIPILEWQRVQWFANSHTLSYIKNVNGYSNIWSYDLDAGSEKQLTSFDSDQIYAYVWSPDYKTLACQRGNKISNVAMLSSDR